MSQTGSGSRTIGSLGSSSDSGSGSIVQKKPDFGKKHRKIIRILTVVAYIMSVSVAALLLSAYYVFLWTPAPSDPLPTADSPSTLAHFGITKYPNGGGSADRYGYNAYSRHTSSALYIPDSSSRSTRVSKKGYRDRPTSFIPTPQGLIMEKLVMSSTTTPVRNPASPPDDPNNPTFRKTTPNIADRDVTTAIPQKLSLLSIFSSSV
jgi:hypothetical protein